MNKKKIEKSRKLAVDFIKSCDNLIKNETDVKIEYFCMTGTKKTGDLRRRSMDLTRSLSEMRTPK